MATFGNTNIGGTSNAGSANPLACKFTAPENGTISSISWYGRLQADGNGRALVYSDSSGTPAALLATSSSQAIGQSFSWVTFNLSLSINNGTAYWLAVTKDQDYSTWYDAGSTNQFAYGAVPEPPQDPFPSPNFLDWSLSIYATYTAGSVQPDAGYPLNYHR